MEGFAGEEGGELVVTALLGSDTRSFTQRQSLIVGSQSLIDMIYPSEARRGKL